MSFAIQMVHARDPKEEILEEIGDNLKDIVLMGSRVLVAVYTRPEKTAGGIIVTQQTQAEDKAQGKVGLVVKVGPLAFTDDGEHKFPEPNPQVGDWVMFRVGDTHPFELGKRRCRTIHDVDVQMIIPQPDMVW